MIMPLIMHPTDRATPTIIRLENFLPIGASSPSKCVRSRTLSLLNPMQIDSLILMSNNHPSRYSITGEYGYLAASSLSNSSGAAGGTVFISSAILDITLPLNDSKWMK
jgi:hypothetical protein